MNTLNSVKTSTSGIPLPRPNPARLRKPFPLPLRPLPPNRFTPPKGQKQVFLPNFTLTFLRTPLHPPHVASFLTPLWLNKLDLKDYLYNLYNVHVLSVRSFVIRGKVVRDNRTGRLRRSSARKKMTIEMPAQGKGQGPFVWPDEPEDLKPWDKELQDAIGKERGEMRKRSRIAEMANMDPGDKGVLAKQARALVEGRRAWRPEWKESRDGAALGRGKEEGEQAVVQEEDEEEKRRQERR